MMYCNLPCITL